MKAKVRIVSLLLAGSVLFGNAAAAVAEPEAISVSNVTVAASSVAADALSWEKEMLALVNAAREKQGIEPLELSTDLSDIASLKAKEMLDCKYFSHVSPNYGKPSEFAAHYGYTKKVGENLHFGSSTAPKDVFKLWNESKNHRKNFLNPKWKYIGVGRAAKPNTSGKKYTDNYHVQLFSE